MICTYKPHVLIPLRAPRAAPGPDSVALMRQAQDDSQRVADCLPLANQQQKGIVPKSSRIGRTTSFGWPHIEEGQV